MRILYIGQPDTERTGAWAEFLERNGHEVATASLEKLGHLDFSMTDLAIVDGEGYDAPQPPNHLLAEDLPVPTVLIGGTGGKVSDAIGLKLGWQFGCLCLNHQAIIAETTLHHPIFRGPYAVPPVATERTAAPEEFSVMANTKNVPEAFDLAIIYTPSLEELTADARPGLVSTSAGFLDSPDTEHILGGINSKAHDYNAVARQGRFLQWGFHGDPQRFTDLGRTLFLNALDYIATFAEAPIETLVMQQYPRDMLRHALGLLDRPEIPDPAAYLRHQFGNNVPAGMGLTAETALNWFKANSGALRYIGTGSDGQYVVDEDLKSIEIANNDLQLVQRLAEELDAPGEVGERARRLWERYLRRDSTDVETERRWFSEHRASLFFSDWAGYRWISRGNIPEFKVPRYGTAEAGDAFLWLTAERPATGSGITATLHITLRPGDYIYAPGATDGVSTAVDLVSEHEFASSPSFPDASNHHLPGHVVIPFAVRGESETLEVDVRLQVCNAQSCSMPMTIRLSASAGSDN